MCISRIDNQNVMDKNLKVIFDEKIENIILK
jgi:hypothetical protein